MRSITKSASIPATVFFDDSSATQDIDKAIGLSFPRIFILYLNLKTCLNPATNSIAIASVSLTKEVCNALLSLDSTKATGIDGISPAVLKTCAIVL